MSARRVDDAAFIHVHRMLSAASGYEYVTTRALCRALDLTPPSIYGYVRRLGLATNGRYINGPPRVPRYARRRWSSPTSLIGRVAADQSGTRLAVLRTVRAVEACTGCGAVGSRVAALCGVSAQRVHQILAEFRAGPYSAADFERDYTTAMSDQAHTSA